MTDKKLYKNIEKIRFKMDGAPYVLLYNKKSMDSAEAVKAIKMKNFDLPNICVMKEIQFRNVFNNGEY